MTQNATFTYTEILSQPEAWAEALDVVQRLRSDLERLLAADVAQVLFTGCGSTYYLSLAAAALFQALTGRPARAVPGGELALNPETVLTASKTLLVAVSRSGLTSETVRAVEQFKAKGRGPVIAITNYGDQPLAGMADLALVIPKGQEQSIAQTRSFASMYVAATALSALAAGRADLLQAMAALPPAGERLIARYQESARNLGENLSCDRFYFLGSGIRRGLACEANLKMKEMTLTHSEPFHFLEFRHGPMSMVTESTVLVGLVSQKNFGPEQAVLSEMQARGGTILALGESGVEVAFESGIPESVRSVLYLPILQLMAFYRALAKGLNPDRPNNLTAVVKMDFA
ncbi:MAG: SIS domain-containing protein [Chloroflexi bacterium HGW-Chloroflexi-1]|nr:MAG: SIS domain-containing protein [Chloroflexi bacterium HGW-Chloroflexi-1]